MSDDYIINWEGLNIDKCGAKRYFITITSKYKYRSAPAYRKDLYEYLHSLNYPSHISGRIELGSRTGWHCHGITSWGVVPKGNKTNQFYIHLKQISTEQNTLYMETHYKRIREYINKDNLIGEPPT